jgi:hypothetical protein
MKDADEDGYGDNAPPDGIANGQDCDDTATQTHPGAAELESHTTCMKDTDEDGYGDDAPPDGIAPGQDCDDLDALLTPADLDNDYASSCQGDCDDSNPSLNLIDIDNDGVSSCDGDCNDNDEFLSPLIDDDDDGYSSCVDCDDTSSTTHPGAAEAESALDCSKDADEDGWGDPSPPKGVTEGTDCDDSDATLTPNDNDGDGYSGCDGDCWDFDSRAYPGQTAYFSSDRGDGSFDFSCDGSEEKQDDISGCTSLMYQPFWAPSGSFSYTNPSCGESASWCPEGQLFGTTCTCYTVTYTKTQSCR